MMLVCTALSNGDQTDDGDHISEVEAEYTLPSTMNSRNRCAYPTYLPGSKNTKYSFRVPGALYCAVLVFYNQCHLHVHICYRHYR